MELDEIKKKIIELLQDDPLYSVLQDTPLEETLYNDHYLTDIVEKKFYSTSEVAIWFEVTDAQLRYYIKPFEHYIFDDVTNNPSTATVIRLNFSAILRLRMILLLKDEYRVKGLKRLLRIDENGYIVKQQPTATTALATTDELANKVEVLSNVLQQMMQTGLFHIQQNDENSALQVTVNEDYLAQNIKLLSADSSELISEIQDRTEKLAEENKSLQKQITEMKEENIQEIVVRIREKQIETEVIATLRTEALERFSNQNEPGIIKKLFRSSQIEIEKNQFVNHYLTEHQSERVKIALMQYHELP